MKYHEFKDPLGTYHVIITFHESEMYLARFDKNDFYLIKECAESKSISDKILALETLARRLEEQNKKKEEEGVKLNPLDKELEEFMKSITENIDKNFSEPPKKTPIISPSNLKIKH